MAAGRLQEARLFFWYMFAVFRPGAQPPAHPHKPDRNSLVSEATLGTWSSNDLDVFLVESRRLVDQQQADKRDIRSRAQILLTTALVLGGATVADLASNGTTLWSTTAIYATALACVLAGILVAAGLLTAQSPIGVPNMDYLESREPEGLTRGAALGYSQTRGVGAETVAVMVTALRDATLALVVGFVLAAVAHFLP